MSDKNEAQIAAIELLRQCWLGKWAKPAKDWGKSVNVTDISGMFQPNDTFGRVKMASDIGGNYKVFEIPKNEGDSVYVAYECGKCSAITLGPPQNELVNSNGDGSDIELRLSCHQCLYPLETLSANNQPQEP